MIKMKPNLKGIIPPIITPFKKNQEIDESGFREQINFLIENGVHGIFVGGTSGEFFSLTHKERCKINEITVDETNHRVPVFAGTGSSGTKETLELTEHAKDIGADVAVIVAPYFTRTTDEGLFKHYEIVANNIDIPIAIYNIPGRAAINIIPPIAKRLAEIKNIVGIKDSSGDMRQIAELIDQLGGRIAVFQGEDQLILESLILGVDGAVPAVANVIPKVVVELYNDVIKKDIDGALKKQIIINRVMRETLAFRPWPVGIKETLNLLGKKGGVVRSPLVMLDEESRKKIKDNLEKLKKLNIF